MLLFTFTIMIVSVTDIDIQANYWCNIDNSFCLLTCKVEILTDRVKDRHYVRFSKHVKIDIVCDIPVLLLPLNIHDNTMWNSNYDMLCHCDQSWYKWHSLWHFRWHSWHSVIVTISTLLTWINKIVKTKKCDYILLQSRNRVVSSCLPQMYGYQ